MYEDIHMRRLSVCTLNLINRRKIRIKVAFPPFVLLRIWNKNSKIWKRTSCAASWIWTETLLYMFRIKSKCESEWARKKGGKNSSFSLLPSYVFSLNILLNISSFNTRGEVSVFSKRWTDALLFRMKLSHIRSFFLIKDSNFKSEMMLRRLAEWIFPLQAREPFKVWISRMDCRF